MWTATETVETAVFVDLFDPFHEATQRVLIQAVKAACGTGHVATHVSPVSPGVPVPYYIFVALGDAESGRRIEQWRRSKRRGWTRSWTPT